MQQDPRKPASTPWPLSFLVFSGVVARLSEHTKPLRSGGAGVAAMSPLTLEECVCRLKIKRESVRTVRTNERGFFLRAKRKRGWILRGLRLRLIVVCVGSV